jgi:hypothetical protein
MGKTLDVGRGVAVHPLSLIMYLASKFSDENQQLISLMLQGSNLGWAQLTDSSVGMTEWMDASAISLAALVMAFVICWLGDRDNWAHFSHFSSGNLLRMVHIKAWVSKKKKPG